MDDRERLVRAAPFSLRVVQRKEGRAAIVYRRRADTEGRDRLQRVAAISPLAFTAAVPLLRDAVAGSQIAPPDAHPTDDQAPQRQRSNSNHLTTGPFHPLDADWGARVACYSLLAAGLRDGERLIRTANHLRHADPAEAAWWLGLLSRDDNVRALRALRILTEAVQ